MSDRAASIRAKIKRAEEHIHDLEIEVGKFRSSNPYEAVKQVDAKTGDYLFKFRVISEPPTRLLAILGDAIHCLRASLDHLAYALVEANNRVPNRSTAFPIACCANEFETAIKRTVNRTSESVKKIFRKLEPYERGNGEWLWRLHQLDIIDKHRLLIVAVARTGAIALYGVPPGFFSGDLFTKGFPKRGTLKDGDALLVITSDQRMPDYSDPAFSFDIVFGEVFKGKVLVPQLVHLVNEVKRTLEPFWPILAVATR